MVNIHPDLTIRFTSEGNTIFSYAENQSKEFTVEVQGFYESEEMFNADAFTGRDSIIRQVNERYEQWCNNEDIATNIEVRVILKSKKFKFIQHSQESAKNKERGLVFNSFILEAPIDEETHKTLWLKTTIWRGNAIPEDEILFVGYRGIRKAKFFSIIKT